MPFFLLNEQAWSGFCNFLAGCWTFVGFDTQLGQNESEQYANNVSVRIHQNFVHSGISPLQEYIGVLAGLWGVWVQACVWSRAAPLWY